MKLKLDDFTAAYIEAALWSSNADLGVCEVEDTRTRLATPSRI